MSAGCAVHVVMPGLVALAVALTALAALGGGLADQQD